MAIPRNLANFAPKLDSSGNPTFTAPTVFSAGTVSAPSITFTGDTNTGIFSPTADTIAFAEGGVEAMRIDSSGRLLIGATTARSDFFNTTTVAPRFQVELAASDNLNRFISVTSNNSDTGGSSLLLAKSRGTTVGAVTIVQNDDQIGAISFQGADGVDMVEAARVSCHVDGTPGSNDMPGSLRFATTADGASSSTERMRIINSGYLKVSNDGTYPDGSTAANHYFNSNSTSESCVFIRSDSASISGMSVLFIRGNRNTTDNTYRLIAANNGNDTGVFNVRDSGNCVNTNNSYGSTSDVKLKQDIVDASSQWDDIKNIRIRKYRFKNNPTAPLSIGVIAQELETVSPGLVESEDDYEEVKVPVLNKEGNPVLNEDGTPAFETQRNPLGTSTKSVKYSVLYMKAVKALQEAQLRIETLEAQNAAFEARLAALEAK